eukprot:1149586-Pelagomonas_calceolata.AAC.2
MAAAPFSNHPDMCHTQLPLYQQAAQQLTLSPVPRMRSGRLKAAGGLEMLTMIMMGAAAGGIAGGGAAARAGW